MESCAKTRGFKNAWGLLPPFHSWPLLLQHRVGLLSRSSVCLKIAFCSLQFGEGTEGSRRSRWRSVASNIFIQTFTPFMSGYILECKRSQQPLDLVLLFSNLKGGCWELLSHLKSWTSDPPTHPSYTPGRCNFQSEKCGNKHLESKHDSLQIDGHR